ncbi:glycoside hydrolase family 3 N-terminal domain-containing protein [Microbulbifer halophilus]|uniref:Glycoside hydrolase family 3 N-terminal domain-containing protein n=1 Tax=Microbulbifer halophilus TaxID=453963 RepID=A0ABW5EI59_9GAMM|nr:glycoside hydrolase family 3 protein [Microbulbifer halophilus]MCW8127765.1 glycoside hydrolase family 3 protein [Microbulbifer halophilus]
MIRSLPRHLIYPPVLLVILLSVSACSGGGGPAPQELSLREKVAQKIMLDIRYYCDDRDGPPNGECRRPVTELPRDLRQLIADTGLGGVVLFADNLVDSAQIVRLNRDLQAAAAQSRLGTPLLIAVDQEGGRVTRLPRAESVAFAGNMAIGATYPDHGDRYARSTAAAMARQLKVLGFNVNFAPTLDVNSNPDNPVINVRSYSEDPQVVGELGVASVDAFQAEKIAATVKHFPGHGDTSVDSHTGLPRVERSREAAGAVDLLPFARVFAEAAPALTMTAHIQYPALDDTRVRTAEGEQIPAPATLSRAILTDLLRGDYGYRGVVATDALDMAGISNYFSPTDAVVKTFAAGADIAVMPIKIRYPHQLRNLEVLIDRVAEAVERGELSVAELDTSAARIEKLKRQYVDRDWIARGARDNIRLAGETMADSRDAELAGALAGAALSPIFPVEPGTLPVVDRSTGRIQVLAPSAEVGQAFRLALSQVTESPVEILHPRNAAATLADSSADVLLVASIVPRESAVERGGMDDLAGLRQRRLDSDALYEIYRDSLRLARERGRKTVFVSMRSPYEAAQFRGMADLQIASYDYKAYIDKDGGLHGPIYEAIARALTSAEPPPGILPVTVEAGIRRAGLP